MMELYIDGANAVIVAAAWAAAGIMLGLAVLG